LYGGVSKMRNKYTVTFTSKCPNDDEDITYEATISTHMMIQVEDIISFSQTFLLEPHYQEDITQQFFDRFGFKIKTFGVHQGVKIECEIEP